MQTGILGNKTTTFLTTALATHPTATNPTSSATRNSLDMLHTRAEPVEVNERGAHGDWGAGRELISTGKTIRQYGQGPRSWAKPAGRCGTIVKCVLSRSRLARMSGEHWPRQTLDSQPCVARRAMTCTHVAAAWLGSIGHRAKCTFRTRQKSLALRLNLLVPAVRRHVAKQTLLPSQKQGSN